MSRLSFGRPSTHTKRKPEWSEASSHPRRNRPVNSIGDGGYVNGCLFRLRGALVLDILAPPSHRKPGGRGFSGQPPRSAPFVAYRGPRPSHRPPATPGGRLRQSQQPSGSLALRDADARKRLAHRDGG